MSPLEFTFVLICAAAGATCGYGLWVMLARLRPAPVVVAAPPAESPRPRDRAEPPLARGETKPGPAGDPALPILPVQEMLARIIEMLKAADEARAASENRLLAEMRAVLTADDPDIRDRLDRIAEALNIPGPPPEEDAEAEARSKLDQWRAEFSEDEDDLPPGDDDGAEADDAFGDDLTADTEAADDEGEDGSEARDDDDGADEADDMPEPPSDVEPPTSGGKVIRQFSVP